MGRRELRSFGELLVAQSRELCLRYPDAVALRGVTVGPAPAGLNAPGVGADTFAAALRYLYAEMVVVREGRAGTLVVLEDEAARVEAMLPLV